MTSLPAIRLYNTTSADAIRDELAAHGIQLIDTSDGTGWCQRV